MEWITSEVINVLTFLLPGFVSAWIFYGLTSNPKPTEFERVVQALIFTVFIQGIVVALGYLLCMVGNRFFCLGVWDKTSSLVWSIVFAIGIGLIFSIFANNDKFHTLLRKIKITRETSFSSEWFGAFSESPTYVVLHLSGERRLYGWPKEWPSDPQKGHFSIAQAEWLDDEKRIPLTGVRNILIPASEVGFVEFMKFNQEENRDES